MALFKKRAAKKEVESQAQYKKYIDARGISRGTKSYAQWKAEGGNDQSAIGKMRQHDMEERSSLEDALSPEELKKLGYKRRK